MTKETKKYSPKYFKEGLPEWKRKKDPITSRIFYRRVSFYTASLMTKLKWNANDVSYFSILIAISAAVLLVVPNYICNIVGAILVNIWLISDCTDGNMARSVKKQPFGDFSDSVSSYILVALLGLSLGINSYFNDGLFIKSGCIWIAFIGALASIGDTLMRLVYQKYKASERNLADQGIITIENDKRTDESQSNSLIVRIESDFGIGGILPFFVLIGVVLKMTDIITIYCFMYYFLSSILMILKYILKAMKKTKEIEESK